MKKKKSRAITKPHYVEKKENLHKTTLRPLIEIQNLPKNGFLTFLYILPTLILKRTLSK